MIALDIEQEIREAACRSVQILPIGEGRFRIFTPFSFDDGDKLSLLLLLESETWILSDGGSTFMRLSYSLDDRALQTTTRSRIIGDAIAGFDIQNRNGELIRYLRPGDDVGEAFFALVQGVLRISDVARLTQEQAQSEFVQHIGEVISSVVPSDRIVRNWHDPVRDEHAIYVADYRVEGVKKPLFVFGLPNVARAKDATITVHQYHHWRLEFTSLAVAPDRATIGGKNATRLHDVVDRLIYSSVLSDERIRTFVVEKVNE